MTIHTPILLNRPGLRNEVCRSTIQPLFPSSLIFLFFIFVYFIMGPPTHSLVNVGAILMTTINLHLRRAYR
ncbi:uncharacterized protein F4807DRAFT_408489 [Annulohypoxylon truncatum]|uniref:uncharacterized protein n=1 Tax=Annulohypoxylon truncatum TaxID=327061 RepID=UPI002008C6CD|nr:uncharacterized protein F4807DRAFT_408489 [Annulohypoxylon truncatum]KAI1213626.1 hypothetical protein F4807DRAFT_408489 [Annulohypoxylon truncatum]